MIKMIKMMMMIVTAKKIISLFFKFDSHINYIKCVLLYGDQLEIYSVISYIVPVLLSSFLIVYVNSFLLSPSFNHLIERTTFPN